jgi:hypothetical protein
MIQLNGLSVRPEIVNERLYLAGAGVASVRLISRTTLAETCEQYETTVGDGAGNAMMTCLCGRADGAMLYDLSSSYRNVVSFTLFGFVGSGAMEGNTVFLLDEEFGLVSVDYSDSRRRIAMPWMP